jgi:CxxC motif-containing protein
MIREYTCILCPNGCEIEACIEGTSILDMQGAACKRGKEYVEQELVNPQRNIATSVSVEGGVLPLVSVRLTKAIPKDDIFDVMYEIKKVKLTAPIKMNQIIIENVLNLNSDVIATKNVDCSVLPTKRRDDSAKYSSY